MPGRVTHPPLGKVRSVTASRGRLGAIVAWLACLGLLSNLLLPAELALALSILDSDPGAISSDLCSATPGSETPGKSKSALLIHHCALCNAPAASLSRRQTGFHFAGELGDIAYPALDGASLAVRFRHGPTQARAPPRIA